MHHYHTVGVGAGPANLSLAALFESAAPHQIALLERRPGPAWHPDLLLSGVRMQTSWLKDLVSFVDPCHRLSFLNYMVTTGRAWGLLNAQFDFIPRQEYAQYLRWASERLGCIQYDTDIDRISFDGGFAYHAGGEVVATSDHLVLGLGSKPYAPPELAGVLGDRAFFPEELTARLPQLDPAEPIAVVGGGQTGAESVLELLGRGFTRISWLGRRPWFQPMDDSPPGNDFYRPAYVRFLQDVPQETRRRLVDDHVLTGDAITPGTLRAIFQANYDGMLRHGEYPVTLYPERDVVTAEADGDGLTLHAVSPVGREEHRLAHAVLATGRQPAEPPLDPELRERIELDDAGELMVESDYSLRWKGPDGHRIFALNRSRHTHGIPDANLTLLPVRSATVINSLFEREIFTIRDTSVSTRWKVA
ncbi:lysine N(6)-hydroxylase/L-ornithine N(5)-oxygenase family protein [Streptomyces sporangiiformans]|uniref:L-lysine N6-monooxygenase MbtG n=1 Tax=Streptomyces sporangiiformans TaxID=2315329 RepID=A0A505D7M5_9ACTN|nr:SidA/IucD/PvdA family monooxygenase [Streptomyces sporangiiformans]TPQ18610.1 L-lysine 6-monooxygenase [Streptomyces sporangiiformans]